MVKADKNKEVRWRKSSKFSHAFRQPAVELESLSEDLELERNLGEIFSQKGVLNENEEKQEQSVSQQRPVSQTFVDIEKTVIHRVVGYCRGKELFIISFVLLCFQLFLLKFLHEANREQMVDVVNKLMTENERFKIEVLAKIKSIEATSKSHEDHGTETVVDGLPGLISTPFSYPIYDGLYSGMLIYIRGRPTANPIRFTLNFQSRISLDPPPDIAFHMDVRFAGQTVVRNSRVNTAWGKEETFTPDFPFQPSLKFDMVIRVDHDSFMVEVNGLHFVEFKHRLRPLYRFDTLYIKDDVVISSINSA